MNTSWFFGFRSFPRKENSLAVILDKYTLTNIVSGNVFARVGEFISKEEHLSLMEKAKKLILKKLNNVSCA